MKYYALVLLLVTGLSLPGLAFDLPVYPEVVAPKPNATPSIISQTGTVVGGGLLAAALLVGGLWINQKRKVNKDR